MECEHKNVVGPHPWHCQGTTMSSSKQEQRQETAHSKRKMMQASSMHNKKARLRRSIALPGEIWHHIFSITDMGRHLLSCLLTCRAFHQLIDNDAFWKQYLEKTSAFGGPLKPFFLEPFTRHEKNYKWLVRACRVKLGKTDTGVGYSTNDGRWFTMGDHVDGKPCGFALKGVSSRVYLMGQHVGGLLDGKVWRDDTVMHERLGLLEGTFREGQLSGQGKYWNDEWHTALRRRVLERHETRPWHILGCQRRSLSGPLLEEHAPWPRTVGLPWWPRRVHWQLQEQYVGWTWHHQL